MKKLTFLFGVHNHQPLGNFPEVYRRAFDQAYWPFLETVRRFPHFRFALHFSGFLWDYLMDEAQEAIDCVRSMVETGQVELLGGGYYEPILSQIPEKDRLAQLNLMNEFLKDTFDYRPKGLWLAERVWEPHLPSLLHQAGFQYTLLDEQHFNYAGVTNIHGYYLTEDQGLKLNLFPIDKTLRYYIPFRPLSELQSYFEKLQDSGQDTAIIGDDGEKFGLWPGTSKWVYEDGWLKNFLEFIESGPVEMITFSQYLERRQSLGRIYIPPASYEEMMEWVLGPEDQKEFLELKSQLPEKARRFIRGGLYRDFSLKYPECHHMRCRQLQVSTEVSQNPYPEARKNLYQAQCNDAYWHGIFGGLYLPHLRRAVYQKLISAELKIPFISGWEKFDFDLDGHDEYQLKTPSFFLWVKPGTGGGITEIDDRYHGINLSNVLTKRQEFYHLYATSRNEGSEARSIHEINRQLPAEAQLWLTFDNYRRLSFLERFLPKEIKREQYENIYYQQTGDFVEQPFTAFLEDESLVLKRQTEVILPTGPAKIGLTKRIRAGLKALLFIYEIENLGHNEIDLTFTSEWNLAFFEQDYQLAPNQVKFFDNQLSLEAPEAEAIWDFRIRTVSQSEKDYEVITQGISFHPVWRLKIISGEKKVLFITLDLHDIKAPANKTFKS